MRLSLLCLAGAVSALPATSSLPVTSTIVAREVRNILDSLRRVSSALDDLSYNIRAIYPRMPSSEVARRWPAVEKSCHRVSDMLWNDASYIRTLPYVNALESTQLLQPITNLESATARVINEWISIKPAMNPNDRQTVLRILRDHETASSEYADAIMGRQSMLVTTVGQLFGQQTRATIQRGIAAYRS